MSAYSAARSNVRATVKTTAAIIYLIIIIILDEIYAAIARWLTILGKMRSAFSLNLGVTGMFSTVFSYSKRQYNRIDRKLYHIKFSIHNALWF